MFNSKMNIHLECLIKAAKEIGVEYRIIHKDKIVIKIYNRYFIHHNMPLNKKDSILICKDKDISYSILCEKIKIPYWQSYLDPKVKPKYKSYVKFKTIKDIGSNIERNFNFPLILKRNRGSEGKNVFLCKNKNDIKNSLNSIYNQNHKNYDYLAVCQQYIRKAVEYRFVIYKGKILFVYEKINKNANFKGNLSPLHWENSKAEKFDLIKNTKLINEIKKNINIILKEIAITYGAFDFLVDEYGKIWLLEINTSPSYNYYLRDNGEEEVINMYKIIIKDIKKEGKF